MAVGDESVTKLVPVITTLVPPAVGKGEPAMEEMAGVLKRRAAAEMSRLRASTIVAT